MAIQHNVIPDAERHEAKGASTAIAGQVLKANGDGTTSFVAPNTLSNISIGSSLEGQSTSDQNPVGTDTPYQVTWGAGSSNSDVNIASNGIVTITNAGLYIITFNLNFGRDNSTGLAILVARLLINGVASGFVQHTQIDQAPDITPFNASITRSFSANDTIVIQLIRDSSGTNDGGLHAFNPTLTGWADSPSAAIRVQKIAGAA